MPGMEIDPRTVEGVVKETIQATKVLCHVDSGEVEISVAPDEEVSLKTLRDLATQLGVADGDIAVIGADGSECDDTDQCGYTKPAIDIWITNVNLKTDSHGSTDRDL